MRHLTKRDRLAALYANGSTLGKKHPEFVILNALAA